MSNQIIKRVGQIGLHKMHAWEFRFLNRFKELYGWMDIIPDDNPEFQGLLEDEAPFLNISAKFPGVPIEEEEEDFCVIANEPGPNFEDLVVVPLENARINTKD
jgi:hypothetical protein